MKRFLTATIIALCILPAMAATKCVKLDPAEAALGSAGMDSMAYVVAILYDGSTMHLSASCSKTVGTNLFETQTTITVADDSITTYCWCRQLSPLISLFVYVGGYDTADECNYECPRTCANMMIDWSDNGTTFRTALYQKHPDE